MLTIAVAFLLHVAPQSAIPQDTVRARIDSLLPDSSAKASQRLERVQVTAIRGRTAPISERTIQRAEIQRRYTGQDTPILLQAAPGVTAYSESGSASNYSYIRLRGIDQTRLNITLDGVPLNEPEDQSLYFSNFPDFANSIASVQVQRGVGSSTFGVASYAGSVNFESVPVSAPRNAEVQLTAGSYDTRRASAVYQSGLLPSGFAAYVRGSSQTTNGYRFNSGNESRSLFASGGWFGTRDVVKATLLAGLSSNDQAYYASPLSVLRTNPRDNPFGNRPEDEVTDRFHQDLASVAWTHEVSPSSSVATTLYGFDAGGWYDFPGDNGLADAYHYRLHSRWGGFISAFDWRGPASTLSVGINAMRYQREHWLTQRPDLDTRYYDNTGHKAEQSGFVKGSLTRGPATFSGDLQVRFVQFRYQPTMGVGVPPASARWSFLNPKVGAHIAVTPRVTAYASVGLNGREPTRSDIFAGADDVDSVTAQSVFPLTRVRAERVYDLETGLTANTGTVRAQVNAFVMQFRNEIAAIGGVSQLGYDLRKNVPRSRRVGLEGDLTWKILPSVAIVANGALTDARIQEYHDEGSGILYNNVTSFMTPKFVSNHGVRSEGTRWLSLDVDGRYVSRMMLTNTNDARFVVPESWYADAGATLRFARQSLLVQVRNVFDRRVYTGGYPDSLVGSNDPTALESYYYIMAPRNVSVSAKLNF